MILSPMMLSIVIVVANKVRYLVMVCCVLLKYYKDSG